MKLGSDRFSMFNKRRDIPHAQVVALVELPSDARS
jgi:hypothetical protein